VVQPLDQGGNRDLHNGPPAPPPVADAGRDAKQQMIVISRAFASDRLGSNNFSAARQIARSSSSDSTRSRLASILRFGRRGRF